MQAIRTRFHPATNKRGARISARCEAGSLMLAYDYGIDNHRAAMETLCKRLGWSPPHYPPMVGGDFGGDTYWVFPPKL